MAMTNRGIEDDPRYVQLLHHFRGIGNCDRVTESQCRESVKEEYKGITLYLGIFHMSDPPPGNEYSDHGESSGNVWLKEKHPVVIIALYMVAKLAYRERTK